MHVRADIRCLATFVFRFQAYRLVVGIADAYQMVWIQVPAEREFLGDVRASWGALEDYTEHLGFRLSRSGRLIWAF